MLAAVEYLTGWNPLPGMAPIEEAMEVVASIGVVMLGSLPAAEFLNACLTAYAERTVGRNGIKTERARESSV